MLHPSCRFSSYFNTWLRDHPSDESHEVLARASVDRREDRAVVEVDLRGFGSRAGGLHAGLGSVVVGSRLVACPVIARKFSLIAT